MSSRSHIVARNLPLVTTASLAATASLACAAFSASQKVFAQAERPTSALSSSNEIRYPSSQIGEIASFIRFLERYESSLPSPEHRARALAALKTEKILDLVGLSPIELRCLETMANSNLDDIHTKVLKTYTKVKGGTFTENDMFGTPTPERVNTPIVSSLELSKPERLAYRKTLGLCYLMRGIRSMKPQQGESNAAWNYITNLPEKRQDALLMTVGALQITPSVSFESLAGRAGRSFLVNIGPNISAEERSKIPQLAAITNYQDTPFVYRLATVTTLSVFSFYLYRRARDKWNEPNLTQ